MKNYISHHFPRQHPLGKPKISILEDQTWSKLKPSNFCLPLKSLLSGCVCDNPRINLRARALQTTANKPHWLGHFVSGFIPSSKERTISTLPASCRNVRHRGLKRCSVSRLLEQHPLLKENKVGQTEKTDIYRTTRRQQAKQCCDDIKSQHKCVLRHNSDRGILTESYFVSTRPRNLIKNRKQEYRNKEETNFICHRKGSLFNNNRLLTKLHFVSFPILVPQKLSRGHLSRCIHNAVRLKDYGRELAKSGDPAVVYEKTKKRNFGWLNCFANEAVLLQPSKGEFSVRKLISKATCPEKGWGLPNGLNFVRSIGPGINDNLIEYIDQRSRMQSEAKKGIDLLEDIRTSQKVKMLIRKANEKNREYALKKFKKNSDIKSVPPKMYRAVTDTVSLKPIEILKIKEKSTKNNEGRILNKKKQATFKNPNSTSKEETTKLFQQEVPKPSLTEYQSSASYKDVFQGIFNKSYKRKVSPKTTLAVFNRQSATAIQTLSQQANQQQSVISAVKPKIIEKVEKEGPEKAIMVPEQKSTVNLKNMTRTPFQKVSNSQPISKSKASFSTVSKMPLRIAMPASISVSELFRKTRDKIYCSMNKNIKVRPKLKTVKRTLKTSATSKLFENTEGIAEEPAIKRTFYSTLGYSPLLYKRETPKPPKSKVLNPKKVESQHIHTSRSGSRREKNSEKISSKNRENLSQLRSLCSCGAQTITKAGEEPKHTTVTQLPQHDQVLMEVMRLCKGVKKKTPNDKGTEDYGRLGRDEKRKKTPIDKGTEDYGRCGLEEKRKPGRRGFVCRLAGLLNIGCGRRKRAPWGCRECGK